MYQPGVHEMMREFKDSPITPQMADRIAEIKMELYQGSSECCGAAVVLDRCMDCKEHASVQNEDEEPSESHTERQARAVEADHQRYLSNKME